MKVNFVISKNMGSKIFSDIFARFKSFSAHEIVVSVEPLDGCDVYHYHRPHLEGRLRKNSVVTVHHDLADNDRSLAFELFLARYKEASAVVCLNSRQAAVLEGAGVANVHVIPHGYDAALFNRRRLRKWHPEQVLNLGFISRRYGRRVKGEQLLYSLAQRAHVDRVAFTLVGEGRSIDAVVLRELGFDVTSLEFLPYRLYPSLYDSLDCLMILSSFEGGPASLPEAIASGTPVISTLVGMAPDLLSHDVNGWLLSDHDEESALSEILRFIGNVDGVFDRVAQGACRRDYDLTWEKVVERYDEIYSSFAGALSQ